jgi:hypothetical protein
MSYAPAFTGLGYFSKDLMAQKEFRELQWLRQQVDLLNVYDHPCPVFLQSSDC